MKKCLCCAESFEDDVDLQNYYINYHGVDENNYFLKKLFTRSRNFCQESVFAVITFAQTEEMKSITTFCFIISTVVGN